MTAPAWHEDAQRLRAEGLSHEEISRQLGHTKGAVSKALNPDRAREYNRRENTRPGRNEQKRAWERENYRGQCEICGAITWKKATRCFAHHPRRDASWRRRKEIQDRWLAGETLPEIAAALNSTINCVGSTMARMRKAGWKLPYRYPGNQRRYAA